MKYLPQIIFILTINTLFGQITISNSNYLFVNDKVVFSEDYLNLKDDNSQFFLRNEAQLVQGSGTTGNSGTGELSVYQDGNVGAYEYNYWCSPIAEKLNSITNNLFGISLLNDITGLTTAAPVTFNHTADYNGSASPLNIEPYWIWKFTTSDEYSEWIHVEENTLINPGEGFTMKGVVGTSVNNPGDNQNYDFRGKPNNGTIGNAVTTGNWTLVGNPYPSTLDALDYLWDTENRTAITGTIYYWEQDQSVNSHYIADYVGGYATYTINAAGTVETFVPATFNTYNGDGSLNTIGSSSSTGLMAYRYIPIGYGFMVEGKTGTTGTVYTRNSHREYYKESDIGVNRSINLSSNQEVITYDDDGLNIIPEDYKRFRLNIDFNDLYVRQLVQTFHSSATEDFDYGLESKSPNGVASDANWVLNGESYVAQAFNFTEDLILPLSVKLEEQMSIRFRIFDIQNFDEDQSIYLHDKEEDTYIDLKTQDYNINLPTGNYIERFEITFKINTNLNIIENEINSISIFQNNTSSQLILLNPNLSKIKEMELIDLNGKSIFHYVIKLNKNKYSFDNKHLSKGIYFVKVKLDNNQIYNKKIVIHD